MQLVLTRDVLDPDSTGGFLSVEGEFFCYTLELPVGDGLPGSAIPPGVYGIHLAPSRKFQMQANNQSLSQTYRDYVKQYADMIPHLHDLPSTRSDILIHWGNDPSDTQGCILVGKSRGDDFVGSSRETFAALHTKLVDALDRGEGITIEVQGGIPELAAGTVPESEA